jgi:hypothetical protein
VRELPPARALRARVGALRQVCRIDRLAYEDGAARGTRLVRVVTGGGLEFELHPDRCLDIGHVTYDGTPMAWSAPAAPAGPAFAEHTGTGWQRTFAGGLLATGGLDHFGSPSADQGVELGMHGRASALPARDLNTRAAPDGDGALEVSAVMEQARLFGENLRLERRVTSRLGATGLAIEDTLTNQAPEPWPHMMLYHMNLGWPLVDDGTTVDIPATRVEARDGAEPGGPAVGPPVPGAGERVLRHDLPPGGRTEITVANAGLGVACVIGVDTATLPYVFQWRMPASGVYALGIEPADTPVMDGRAAARAAGALGSLEPGESRVYRLDVRFRPYG